MDHDAPAQDADIGKCTAAESTSNALEEIRGDITRPIAAVLSNQKLNSYLKEIADLCGIEKNITFHLARHTFAMTMTLAKGVPIETVSKMPGHTNIVTAQIYARITNDKIGRNMQALEE